MTDHLGYEKHDPAGHHRGNTVRLTPGTALERQEEIHGIAKMTALSNLMGPRQPLTFGQVLRQRKDSARPNIDKASKTFDAPGPRCRRSAERDIALARAL
jgi:hypothetical protein